MAVAIAVKVRFFARLRELAGTETDQLRSPIEMRAADVYEAMRTAHPSLPLRESVRPAINMELADWDAYVSDGDEVAFIPPVSGGI